MTQITVTGAFVNKTLFEQAGIAMPGEKAAGRIGQGGEGGSTRSRRLPLALDRSVIGLFRGCRKARSVAPMGPRCRDEV